MSDTGSNDVEEYIKKIEEDVYVEEKTLKKIVGLLCRIKNKNEKFPSAKLPRGIIFYGPPGTGKTLLMRTLTEKLDIPYVEIHGPEIMSQYYGKTEENLRRKFKKAKYDAKEKGLAIIYIDELDSIAPSRTEVKGELEQRLVGQLLTLMDGLSSNDDSDKSGHVIVIGSTNRIESIDPALRRPGRFDYEFEFEIPDKDGRTEILKILASNNGIGRLSKKDYEDIALNTAGFTGADLQHLINEAILNAIMENRNAVTKEDIVKAIDKVIPSGLREYIILEPKEPEDEKIANKVEEIFDKIPKDKNTGEISNFHIIKVVSEGEKGIEFTQSIAAKFKEKYEITYRVIRMNSLTFITKWFGETERKLENFFNKIKTQSPVIVHIDGFHIIASPNDEKLERARYVILNQLMDMKSKRKKVILLISLPPDRKNDIDPYIDSLIPKKQIVEI